MAEIIAYHGWGFDHICWADWVKYWSHRGHSVQCFDRGYWGQPSYPQFSDHLGSIPRMLLIHSFGFHLCPLEMIKAASQIIIFNSFLNFHPQEPRLQQRSRRTVD
ncbi:MAG: alpha/beta hydrolase, partial [Merismopedia sp. SIO2A8]|nr:alpha/beta hydrolase [Merismopedia sp. SIO2A8]